MRADGKKTWEWGWDLAEEGKEGEREEGAGSGAEPQVGEERVFPVSPEVIHRETSGFVALLLCP